MNYEDEYVSAKSDSGTVLSSSGFAEPAFGVSLYIGSAEPYTFKFDSYILEDIGDFGAGSTSVTASVEPGGWENTLALGFLVEIEAPTSTPPRPRPPRTSTP